MSPRIVNKKIFDNMTPGTTFMIDKRSRTFALSLIRDGRAALVSFIESRAVYQKI